MKTLKIYGTAAEINKVNYADIRLPYIDRFIFVVVLIVRHIIVVLKTPNRIGDRIIDSKNIYDMMSTSPWFPAPDPPLAEFLMLITEYENAAAAVKAGKASAEADLHLAWEALNAARKLLLNYVQNVCVKNHDNAEKIALSAGMSIKVQTKRNVSDFAVKALAGGGADLSSKVKARRFAAEWQCTDNPDDPTGWYKKIIPVTLKARTKAWGFTKGTTVYFRFRFILKDGPTDWSDVISLFII